MTNKLSHISINDKYIFTRKTAMERCFSPYTIGQMSATAATHDHCYAWFPRAEYVRNGKVMSGSSTMNWKNHFEDGNEKIISWLYDGEYASDSKKEPTIDTIANPLHCFWRDDHSETGDGYRYVGTYLEDLNESEPRCIIYRRLRTEIDLSQWYSHGGVPEWQNADKEGYYVFKKIYIKGFQKQKQLLDEYNTQRLPSVKIEEATKQAIIESVNTFSIIDVDRLVSHVLSNLREFDGTVITKEDIVKHFADYNQIGMFFFDVLQCKDNAHNRIIRTCPLGQEIAGKIFALFDSKYYLYSLSEEETEFYLDKLKIHYNHSDDLTEKHCILYFWKQCNEMLDDLTPFEYHRFLQYVFGKEEKNIIIIPISEEERLNSESIDFENQLEVNDLLAAEESLSDDLFYVPTPEKRLDINKDAKASKASYPRDPRKRISALRRACFACEVSSLHETFISKSTGKPYIETHHLIPLEYWESFENSLDVEANIVCVCSNCHNLIHYGIDAPEIISKLYESRKTELEAAGIGITLEQLLGMYDGTYRTSIET